MKRQHLISFVLIALILLVQTIQVRADEEDNTSEKYFGGKRVLDYNAILDEISQKEQKIDETITQSMRKCESSVASFSNEDISEWYEAGKAFTRSTFRNGKKLRDENEDLIIKRKLGYLRIIEKRGIEESRNIASRSNKTLDISKEDALESALVFSDYIGIERDQIWDVDIKVVAGESGGENGVVEEKVEAEYLVTIYRSINNTPVADSRVRLAISDSGIVTRVLAQWPILEAQPVTKQKVDISRVALKVYDQLDAIYYKNPKVSYGLYPVIVHQEDGDVIRAMPALRVMVVRSEQGPVIGFDINLVE